MESRVIVEELGKSSASCRVLPKPVRLLLRNPLITTYLRMRRFTASREWNAFAIFVFVIRTLVPHGRVLCAVVSSDATYVLPHAVL
jgi:hypothetical protein